MESGLKKAISGPEESFGSDNHKGLDIAIFVLSSISILAVAGVVVGLGVTQKPEDE